MKKSSSKQNAAGKDAPFLGARFRFHALATLLKLQRDRQEAKPMRVKLEVADPQPEAPICPYCRGAELRVYRRALDDEWGCCPQCGFATDPVGLVATELHCSPKEAVEYLVFQHNLKRVAKTDIAAYLWHRNRYEQWAAFLRERLCVNYSLREPEAEHGLNPNSLHHLLKTLDLCQAMDADPNLACSLTGRDNYRYINGEHTARDTDPRHANAFPFWQNIRGVSQGLFGVADHMTVESWFFPNLYHEPSGRVLPNTSPMRLFHGEGWGLVLVVPLQDVPGHFCGVLFIGRNGKYPQDYVIRLFPDFGRRTDDAGFILPMRAHRIIVRSEANDCGRLVAYNNPLHLIRTHLHYHAIPDLPLIGWIDVLETASHLRTTSWSPFSSIKDKVFWMQSHQHWTVRSAMENDAKILLYDPFKRYPKDDERGNRSFQRFRPTWTALDKMVSDAVPWPQYLDAYFANKPPEQAAEELKLIALTPQLFETCVAKLPRSSEVRRLVNKTVPPTQFKIGQYDIFDEPAGIFRKTPRQNAPILVTDVKCFLDEVCVVAKQRKTYRGRILFAGQTIAFDTPVNIFDKDPMSTVSEKIRSAGLPKPNFQCKNRFYKALVSAMSARKNVEAKSLVRAS